MKLVCLLGSPRPKGNSAIMAKRFCEKAEQLGATVQVFALNKLTYRGCQACYTCKTKLEKCVLKDDLAEVLEAVRDTDVLLMASPLYYADISSQMKAFVDRTFSFLKPDYTQNPVPSRLSPGKQLVFIQAQGSPDESMYTDVYLRYEFYFSHFYGFKGSHLIRACGVYNKGDVESREDILTLIDETAERVFA